MNKKDITKLIDSQEPLVHKNIDSKLFQKRAIFNLIRPIQICDQDQNEYYLQRQDFTYVNVQTTTMLNQQFKMNNVQWSEFIEVKKKNYLIQYKYLEKIGSGGFGCVNKVASRQTSQIKAAKVINKSNLSTENKENLKFQLLIMKKIDHPNIIKLYQVYDHPKQLVLIMQYCSGNDLFNIVKKKKYKQQKVKNIIRQLLKAVFYLHENRIIHRDIKPHNIMIEDKQKENIKLIDFGISKTFKEGQKFSSQDGTPIIMAPQMIKQKYDCKCDVWAVGVTMFYLISGNFPFSSLVQKQLQNQILTTQPKFINLAWDNVSQNCKEIIKMMLRKNPLQRPSAKMLLQNLYFRDQSQQTKTLKKTKQARKTIITKNLRTFHFENRLHAIIQTFIASQILTNKEKDLLKEMFQQFDTNKNGVICAQQLRKGLQKFKTISTERIQILMLVMDTNNSGSIDYTQFLAAGFNDSIQIQQQRLKKMFRCFDKDQNGKISYQQVVEFLINYKQSKQDMRKAFNSFDINGDGCISYDQFVNLLLKQTKTISLEQLKQKSMMQHLYKRKSQNQLD